MKPATGELIVFLGPSLPSSETRRIARCTVLPPARQGDIWRALIEHRPRAIALIDGVFESQPSVWHGEILDALDSGVRVFGASSMGALRAAELQAFGMVGVGPFLTIPLMVAALGGPHIVYAWAFGAVLALCDGLVYAELGAALPGSGGPYVYLREAYAPFGLGRLMAFVFIFQVMLVAPLGGLTWARRWK